MNQSISKLMIIITVILMDLLTGMEFDIFVPSFPELQSHFSLTPFWVEALLSVNFIGYCISLFIVGGLADRYGRKVIILLGLLIFIIGSILCLGASFYKLLFIGRLLQGIGIAAPAVLSFLIIADSYPLKEQQFLLAMLNGSKNVAVAIAPIIGSYVALYFHWRGNFMLLLLLGILVLVMTILLLPTYKLSEKKVIPSLSGYTSIFRSVPLMILIVNLIFIFVPYWIFVGMSPLLYIKDFGMSLARFGYYQGLFAFVFALGSIMFGLIIKNANYNQKKMLYVSIQIYIFSILLLALISFLNSTNPMLITLAFLPFVIGQIIPSTILYPLCLNFMPQAKGRVSAIVQGGLLIFSALSLQIAGYFYNGTFRSIGMIIIIFISLAIITLLLVIQTRALWASSKIDS